MNDLRKALVCAMLVAAGTTHAEPDRRTLDTTRDGGAQEKAAAKEKRAGKAAADAKTKPAADAKAKLAAEAKAKADAKAAASAKAAAEANAAAATKAAVTPAACQRAAIGTWKVETTDDRPSAASNLPEPFLIELLPTGQVYVRNPPPHGGPWAASDEWWIADGAVSFDFANGSMKYTASCTTTDVMVGVSTYGRGSPCIKANSSCPARSWTWSAKKVDETNGSAGSKPEAPKPGAPKPAVTSAEPATGAAKALEGTKWGTVEYKLEFEFQPNGVFVSQGTGGALRDRDVGTWSVTGPDVNVRVNHARYNLVWRMTGHLEGKDLVGDSWWESDGVRSRIVYTRR